MRLISAAWNVLPLIFVMIIVYWVLLAGVGVAEFDTFLDRDRLQILMASGDKWGYSTSDLLLTFTLFALFFEIVKATSTDSKSIMNHGLSMVVFVVALVLFITVPGFATSTFFLMTMMAMVDVVGGFIISIVTARRDIGVGPDGLFGS